MLKYKLARINERESYGDGRRWSRGSLIGKGNSCSVFSSHLKPDLEDDHHKLSQKMAVKSTKDPMNISSLHGEKYILNTLQGSPYIIQCFGYEETIGKTGERAFNLLLEYGDGGTLRDRIRRSWGKGLEEEEVRIFAKCIAEGLHHIHAKGYMHRDLRPENIILVTKCIPDDEPGKDCTNDNAGEGITLPENKAGKISYTAKIRDFDCAKDFRKLRKWVVGPYLKGNIRYLSPEAAVANRQGPEGDVWALGCIVFEMLKGENVWRMASNSEVADVLLEMGNGPKHYGKIPVTISNIAISFMEACFVIDSKYRWSAEMLLDHPYIKGV